VRLLPPRLAGGMRGAISAHCHILGRHAEDVAVQMRSSSTGAGDRRSRRPVGAVGWSGLVGRRLVGRQRPVFGWGMHINAEGIAVVIVLALLPEGR
jgi:hypothetical protein